VECGAGVLGRVQGAVQQLQAGGQCVKDRALCSALGPACAAVLGATGLLHVLIMLHHEARGVALYVELCLAGQVCTVVMHLVSASRSNFGAGSPLQEHFRAAQSRLSTVNEAPCMWPAIVAGTCATVT
jgi:hypothetical protein